MDKAIAAWHWVTGVIVNPLSTLGIGGFLGVYLTIFFNRPRLVLLGQGSGSWYANAIAQVEHYLLIGGIKDGILLFLPDAPSDMERLDKVVPGIDGRLVVLSPVGSNPSLNRTASGLRPPAAG